MRPGSILNGMALAAVAVALGACVNVFGPSVPDDPGLYAVIGDGKHLKLNGDPEWERKTWAERSNLTGGVRFIVVHPSLSDETRPVEAEVQLYKVGWVRSEIGPGGRIGPFNGPKWVAPAVDEFALPLRFVRPEGAEQAIGAAPERSPLEPGLYSIQLRSRGATFKGRFGVRWASVDRQRYAADNCLDRYTDGNPQFRPCSAQKTASAGEGLRVYLVDPDHRVVDGRKVLILKGTIINVSDRPRLVPALEASLRDAGGRPLHNWRFTVPIKRLDPGESANFQATARNVPDGTKRAFVSFTPEVSASPAVAGN